LTGLSDNLLKLEYCPGFKKLTNESWASEGGKGGIGLLDFENFAKIVFLLSSGKKQI